MSRLVERLRDVVRPGPATAGSLEGTGTVAPQDAVAGVLDGRWHEGSGGRYLVIERTYAPGYRHGHVSVADSLPPSDGIWPTLSLLGVGTAKRAGEGRHDGSGQPAPGAPGCDDAHAAPPMLFLDLETTGLAGGAGTYAFLIGCAWFDGARFRIRQLFLSSYVAERAVLEALAGLVSAGSTLVTYNGKSFDVPLIETRFLVHRMTAPFARTAHVDMLHSARHLWRADEEVPQGSSTGCRLSELERVLCGHDREDDVPGFEIPSRYFHYVRTGDARPLYAVLEHNRLDLLALALLTARAAQLLEDGPSAARTAREALGLGRLYERSGLNEMARTCYAQAAGLGQATSGSGRGEVRWDDSSLGRTRWQHDWVPAGPATCAEALRAYALLCRRQRDHESAAAAWQQVLELRGCPPRLVREAAEALAIHHEHRRRDPLEARRLALRSLQLQATAVRQEALRHRLSRLERKLGRPSNAAARLFSADSGVVE